MTIDGWKVSGGKSGGVQPGFRMTDPEGQMYQVEVDPPSNPELASGAEIIGTAFYHAIGYNVVDVYLAELDRESLVIADNGHDSRSAQRPSAPAEEVRSRQRLQPRRAPRRTAATACSSAASRLASRSATSVTTARARTTRTISCRTSTGASCAARGSSPPG